MRKISAHVVAAARQLAGTFFEQASMPLTKVATFVMLFFSRPQPREGYILAKMGFAKQTVVDWSSFVREVDISYIASD